MPLPPLAPVPHLRRLLYPEEQIIYTARLHWLNGWPLLASAVVCGVLGLAVWGWLALVGVPMLMYYFVPFRTNEIAVTTHRLLLRTGRRTLRMESVEAGQLVDWELVQTPVTNVLNAGAVTLQVREDRDVRNLPLPLLQHPLSFLEALETLEYRPNKI